MPLLFNLQIKNPIADLAAGSPFYDGSNRIAAELKCRSGGVDRKEVCPLAFTDEKGGPCYFRTPDGRTEQYFWINPVYGRRKRHFREHVRRHKHYVISPEENCTPQVQHAPQRRMA